MSWSFEGWRGIVYSRESESKRLADEGLEAYAAHPLLRCVEIDRSFYEPLRNSAFQSFAERVPEQFRFVVKAHEDCTLLRFPEHARYGKRRLEENPRFLDPSYAADVVVGPAVEGLGAKLGVLLFQFPPQAFTHDVRFPDVLQRFLSRLPKGVPYAVEVRNAELLTAEYGRVLAENGVIHCHNIWGAMPEIHQQARQLPKAVRKLLLVRWLLRRGDSYEGARSRMAPFNRLSEPDPATRDSVAELVARAVQFDVPALVLVNNKAEGCAPASIFEIAAALAGRLK
jgi:uncharacterized protein YecE (DUF72 family)